MISNTKLTFDPDVSRSYTYCSDTSYYRNMCIYSKCGYYHEATFGDDEEELVKRPNMLRLDIVPNCQRSGCEATGFEHFSARYRELEQLHEEAKSVLKTLLAEDGMKISL